MPYLLPDSLHYVFGQMSWTVTAAGKKLFADGKARVTYLDETIAICEVLDREIFHQVTIRVLEKRLHSLEFSCTCSEIRPLKPCQHVPAAVYALIDYLQNLPPEAWKYKLYMMAGRIEGKARKSDAASLPPGILFFGLDIVEPSSNSKFIHRGILYPFYFLLKDWLSAEKITESENPVDVALQALQKRGVWEKLIHGYKPRKIRAVNVSPEVQELIDLGLKEIDYSSPFHYRRVPWWPFHERVSLPLTHLRLLPRIHAPVLLVQERYTLRFLHLLPELVQLSSVLAERENGYFLDAGFELQDGRTFLWSAQEFKLVGDSGYLWALTMDMLVEIANPFAASMLICSL